MSENSATFIQRAQEEAKTTAILERQGDKIWDVINSPAHYYESTFASLLENLPGGISTQPLRGVIEQRKKEKGAVFVMDAMGQGRFYASKYPVDGEVANSLTNPRNTHEQNIDKQHNMEFVAGDITTEETQQQIQDFLKKNESSMRGGFDFIFCRPKGGWSVIIPDDHADNAAFVQYMQWHVTNSLYHLLSPDNGSLLIDYFWRSTNPTPLFEVIEQDKTIKIEKETKQMLLIRTPESPHDLPFPNQSQFT